MIQSPVSEISDTGDWIIQSIKHHEHCGHESNASTVKNDVMLDRAYHVMSTNYDRNV